VTHSYRKTACSADATAGGNHGTRPTTGLAGPELCPRQSCTDVRMTSSSLISPWSLFSLKLRGAWHTSQHTMCGCVQRIWTALLTNMIYSVIHMVVLPLKTTQAHVSHRTPHSPCHMPVHRTGSRSTAHKVSHTACPRRTRRIDRAQQTPHHSSWRHGVRRNTEIQVTQVAVRVCPGEQAARLEQGSSPFATVAPCWPHTSSPAHSIRTRCCRAVLSTLDTLSPLQASFTIPRKSEDFTCTCAQTLRPS
jgi:hypothetical protein